MSRRDKRDDYRTPDQSRPRPRRAPTPPAALSRPTTGSWLPLAGALALALLIVVVITVAALLR